MQLSLDLDGEGIMREESLYLQAGEDVYERVESLHAGLERAIVLLKALRADEHEVLALENVL